jgi:eukaryotic-like serine/threonine-protein kinase
MDEIPGYDLEVLLGAGAMGTVHRARQRSMDRAVAIKRVRGADDEQRERLRREAAVLAELDHPNIVRILEVLPDGDGLAIVMQHAPGGSLADRLEQRGPLSPAALVALAAPVADALASAHRRGVLHRDVKPANILFTSDGLPLLSDFGIARQAGARPLTAPDATGLGTAEYLDPAVAEGAEPDERSDVYALGVTCYEALAGRRPFEGATPLAVLRAADRGDAPPLPSSASGIPPALVTVVERAMARDPALRFTSAAELAEALRDAVPRPSSDPRGLGGHGGAAVPGGPADSGGPARPVQPVQPERPARPERPERPETRVFGPRPPAPPGPEERRTPWPAIVAVALVLLVVPTAAVLALRGDGPAPEPTAAPTTPPDAATPTPSPSPSPLARTDCPEVGDAEAPPGTEVLVGDLDGDGCEQVVRRTGKIVEAELDPDEPPRRYEIGALGDALVLGDWNCDGAQTPGLYRPATGEVFLFFGWADAGRPLVAEPAETLAPGGRPRVTQGGPGGCDVIEVIDRPSVEA